MIYWYYTSDILVMTASGVIQLLAYGCQEEHITSQPEITFFKTTYKLVSNFSVIIPYEAHVFATQIKHIDWPKTRFSRLPDHIIDAIFQLTDFETSLMHGRFEAAISMLKPFMELFMRHGNRVICAHSNIKNNEFQPVGLMQAQPARAKLGTS